MQTSIQNLLRVRFIGHNKFISLYLTYGSLSHITKTRPVERQDVFKIYVHLLAPHSWLCGCFSLYFKYDISFEPIDVILPSTLTPRT